MYGVFFSPTYSEAKKCIQECHINCFLPGSRCGASQKPILLVRIPSPPPPCVRCDWRIKPTLYFKAPHFDKVGSMSSYLVALVTALLSFHIMQKISRPTESKIIMNWYIIVKNYPVGLRMFHIRPFLSNTTLCKSWSLLAFWSLSQYNYIIKNYSIARFYQI